MKKIYKGFHYCLNFLNFKPYINKKYIEQNYIINFTDSCKYDIGKDQSDINKLFGVSYGYHHNQSDRIGWRYNIKTNMIDILLYSYENKKRYSFHLCSHPLNTNLNLSLKVKLTKNYRFVEIKFLDQTKTYCFTHNLKNWGYTLGSYFGGNRTAPHTIKFMLKKVKFN